MTQKEALDILKTGVNVFLTGEPGAGKTHTINEYVKYLRSHGIEPAITASTGIAATHIHGMTIHSWSGIGVARDLSDDDIAEIATSQYIKARIKKTSVLIVDEVSMLDSDTLNNVERVCRRVKKSPQPFGGMQVVFVGDFFQLPPISKYEGRKLSVDDEDEKNSTFSFNAPAWRLMSPVVCYLTEQHRQEDDDFLEILSVIRRNEIEEHHFEKMKLCLTTLDELPNDATRLFSHNANVDTINDHELRKLPGKTKAFLMADRGPERLVEALKRGCLSPERLELKEGASVMFTKNNPTAGFVNGTLGTVVGFDEESKCPVVMTRDNVIIIVKPVEWAIEEDGEVLAKINQIPLRLAWAITIHKSQGMSMDAAVMDLSRVFEFGQGYVALSRVRSLSGVYLLGIHDKAFQVSPQILVKDKEFQQQSFDALEEYTKLSADEIFNRQKDFIRLCGGFWGEVLDSSEKKSLFSPVSKPSKQKTENSKGIFEEIRKQHKSAYKKWNEDEERQLRNFFEKHLSVEEISKKMGRKPGSIRSRLKKMDLL